MAKFAFRRFEKKDDSQWKGLRFVVKPHLSRKSRQVRGKGALQAATLLCLASVCAVPRTVWATTSGNQALVNGNEILSVMGLNPIVLVGATAPFDFSDVLFGYIKNDYIGVVVGFSGGFSLPIGFTTTSVSHVVPGMISFGNQTGSLLTGDDDLHALNGSEIEDVWLAGGTYNTTGYGVPAGLGVWPLASYWVSPVGDASEVDSSAYVSAQIDVNTNTAVTNAATTGTTIQVVGSNPANTLIQPNYYPGNSVLAVRYLLLTGTAAATTTATTSTTATTTTIGGLVNGLLPTPTTVTGVTMDEYIELYRATARVHWHLYNSDTTAHTVTLRFTVPIRGENLGFYYNDAIQGQITQSTGLPEQLVGSSIPESITVYGARYEDPNSTTHDNFAAQQIYRGTGVTTPTEVWLTDLFNVAPSSGGFNPTDLTNTSYDFSQGLATASYFGPYTIAPGQSQDIYTYYGNGAPSQNLQSDVAVGVESTESLQYNSASATNTTISPNNSTVISSGTSTTAAQQLFLSAGTNATPIAVKGSIYNRAVQSGTVSPQLTGTTFSLIPSAGLAFADLPSTTTLDTATKTIGVVPSDTDMQTQWYLQVTNGAYGALSYQVSASSNEISARTVSRVINVPATPISPSFTSTTYQMIGFPFSFDKAATDDYNPSTIINTLAPAALQDTPPLLFLYQWVPNLTSAGYDAGSYQLATQIIPGVGYFYKPKTTRNVYAYGAAPYPGQASTVIYPSDMTNTTTTTTTPVVSPVTSAVEFALPRTLQPGWNMITNPYLYAIPISQLSLSRVDNATEAGTAGTSTFLTAVSSGLVLGTVYEYDVTTNSYDYFDFDSTETPVLQPWTGYWIFLNYESQVYFPLPGTHNTYIVPDPATGDEPSTRGVIASGHYKVTAPNKSNWTLQLIAKGQNGAVDQTTTLGVTTKSQALMKPPSPAAGYVYVSLTKASDPRSYAAIYQAPGLESYTWNVNVTSDQTGTITLTWPNIAAQPRNLNLKLINLDTGTTTTLRSRSSLQVGITAGKTARYQLVAASIQSSPLQISGLAVMHHGTRAAGASGADIVFNLTQEATVVTAQVVTLRGKTITTISADTTKSATVRGLTTLHWDGKNSSGSAVPPGIYHIIVRASNADASATADPKSVDFTSLR